jgi:hypothetical protein
MYNAAASGALLQGGANGLTESDDFDAFYYYGPDDSYYRNRGSRLARSHDSGHGRSNQLYQLASAEASTRSHLQVVCRAGFVCQRGGKIMLRELRE